MNPGLFVAIEGVDGVGKSSLAGRLRDQMGARLFHFPPQFVRFRDEISLDEAVPPVARLLYYVAATVHLSEMVRAARTREIVLCDRYWASPLSLLTAQQALPATALTRLCAPFERYLERPHLTLLVTADKDTVRSRIAERARRGGAVHPLEVPLLESDEFLERMGSALRHYAAALGPVVEMDTTALTEEEAAAMASSLVAAAVASAHP